MPTKIISAATVGLDAVPIEVEADVSAGLPNFVIVGLPDAAVQEARERVRAALRTGGLPFPRTRLTVNLAPADLRKEGPAYDLPIAVAILEAAGAIPSGCADECLFLGELALDGSLRPASGALSAALLAAARGMRGVYLPAASAAEAALAPDACVYPVHSIGELVLHLRGERLIVRQPATAWTPQPASADCDFADIRGQAQAKRALEIAAAGGHNVLLSGPPGSGKTMLARAMPGILPPLMREEAIEITKVRAAAGLGALDGCIAAARPFRAPHHTASPVALIGGGAGGGWPRPGEVSLAHRGVLFLDEFPEFTRATLENLRQPLEDGVVTIARAGGSLTFPAKFILIAARNPCPCGFASDPGTSCACPPAKIAAYGRKISGPLLDRIDLHVEVPRVPADELLKSPSEEPSETVRARVSAARERQRVRLAPYGLLTNSEVGQARLRKLARLDAGSERLLQNAATRLHLSARAVARTLRLALTIADLDAANEIAPAHLAEAIQYREQRT